MNKQFNGKSNERLKEHSYSISSLYELYHSQHMIKILIKLKET